MQLKVQLEKEEADKKREFQAGSSQTEEVKEKEFRKEWIGKSDGASFNDAEVVEDRGEALIKAVTVFKTA